MHKSHNLPQPSEADQMLINALNQRDASYAMYVLEMFDPDVDLIMGEGGVTPQPAPLWYTYATIFDWCADEWLKFDGLIASLIERAKNVDGVATEFPRSLWPEWSTRFRNTETASSIVLGGIRDRSRKGKSDFYRFDLPNIFSLLGDPSNPFDEFRVEERDKIIKIHDLVSFRLQVQATALERQARASLSPEAESYWLQKLVFPELDHLPVPSSCFVDAVTAACDHPLNANSGTGIERLLAQSDAAEEMSAARRLYATGRASHIRRQDPEV